MYRQDSRSFLERARARLDEHTPDALFYAALELRFGIECRMKEYLETQTHISKAMKSGWRVAHLGRSIERAFRTGDKIVQIEIHDPITHHNLYVLYYTPVTKRMQKKAERLGNYLHAPSPEHLYTPATLDSFRSYLEETWADLQIATTGRLLGVPLLHEKSGKLGMTIEFESDDAKQQYMLRVGGVGSRGVLTVKYLNELPSEARI